MLYVHSFDILSDINGKLSYVGARLQNQMLCRVLLPVIYS